MVNIKIKTNGDLPEYQTYGSSGFDLVSNETNLLLSGQRRLFKTGISVQIPIGYEIQIRSRSGLALHHGIMVLNSPGTIDSDYRGEIGVILYNTGSENYVVHKGDRIAQAVLCKVERAEFEKVSKLEDTVRGVGGFGHTGN